MIAALFYHPLPLSADGHLWLILPLCAAVGIVYKTIRTERLRRLPGQVLAVMGYMVVGLIALGVGLWALREYWPYS